MSVTKEKILALGQLAEGVGYNTGKIINKGKEAKTRGQIKQEKGIRVQELGVGVGKAFLTLK